MRRKAIATSIDQLNTDIMLGQKFNLVQFTRHPTALRKFLEPEAPPFQYYFSTTGAVTYKPAS